jgi:hypothetical protein
MRLILALALLVGGCSAQITAISFGTPYNYNTGSPKHIRGDRFITTWGASGTIYVTTNDTNGWQDPTSANVMMGYLDGYTDSLTGYNINYMSAWGSEGQTGTDGATYKSYGLISVGGVLYMFVARDVYATGAPYIETTTASQLIKSSDNGVTWTPAPPSTAQPYASPMFPGGEFPTPMFLQYGQNYSCPNIHNCQNYVYAYSNLPGSWNNGNSMILGRVSVANIGNLSASDWTFYQGGDGMQDANWGSYSTAATILSGSYQASMADAQYIPAAGRYLLPQWYYTTIPGGWNKAETTWNMYESPTPWGPWTNFQSTNWTTYGYYCPAPIPPSISGDNLTFTATDFSGSYGYTMWLIPATITADPLAPSASISGGRAVSGGRVARQ